MRMLYTGTDSAMERAQSDKFDAILKEENKVEISESTINIYMHLLREYKNAKNQNDACMLIYLVKMIEKHLESLAVIQANTCEGSKTNDRQVIVQPSTLKKLYTLLKKIRNDSIPDLTCAIFFYKQSIDKSCSLLFGIIGRHNSVDLVEEFKSILNETLTKKSHAEVMKVVQSFVPQYLITKLKQKGKSNQEMITAATLDISEAIK